MTKETNVWLNLVETLFGKMARRFLRGMRVQSWDKLKAQIEQRIAEIDQVPVVHRGTQFPDP